MVKTYGLTHVAVAVRDLDRTEAFYVGILGANVVYRDAGFLQMQTPGSRDVLVFEKDAKKAGTAGGVLHFGFRLMKEHDIDAARAAVKKAGRRSTPAKPPGEPDFAASGGTRRTYQIQRRDPVDRSYPLPAGLLACLESILHAQPEDARRDDRPSAAGSVEPMRLVCAVIVFMFSVLNRSNVAFDRLVAPRLEPLGDAVVPDLRPLVAAGLRIDADRDVACCCASRICTSRKK